MDRIILVTGANRGLGLEFVKQFLHHGHRVVAAAREYSPELLNFVKKFPNHCEYHPLDVTNAESLKSLEKLVQKLPHLDWVICNAGVMGPSTSKSFEATSQDYLDVFQTNVLGPLEVARVCMPKLSESKKPLLASITSLMGSIADNKSGGYGPYRVSKAALNMLNKNLSWEYLKVPCVVLHPGWVQTRMGGEKAPLKAHESVEGMIEVLEKIGPKYSGKFFNYDGTELPW